jgi:hypothetical protein
LARTNADAKAAELLVVAVVNETADPEQVRRAIIAAAKDERHQVQLVMSGGC